MMYLYTRFERFWHWVQTLLVFVLGFTGFEIHGSFHLLGFERAFTVHNYCGWAWLVLYAFIVFWLLTTGEWRQYTPTFRKLAQILWFYAYGIFAGREHPVPKTKGAKHNPLQRLTYLGVVSVLVPFQLVTGFLVYTYNSWPAMGWEWSLETVALLHTAGGFAFILFTVVHIYMITTGHTVGAHTRAMITGWEEIPESESVAGWETRSR
jgi:thiosulfate reductase cytochrome b subunit